MIKVAFIGGLENGYIVYKYLKSNKYVDLKCVITYRDDTEKPFHKIFPNEKNIFKSNNANDFTNQLSKLKLDVIFVAGWSEILNSELINLPRIGTIGFHPSKLPMDRGRSVLAWQIADGYTSSALTMFFYNEIPDGGDIIGQDLFTIEENDYIIDVLRKVNNSTENLIKSMFPKDWNLPNVYLLHGSLSTEEMNKLYNHPKVKAFVSLTHGEGFGRPLLEASMVGLPVITSGWSGQIDFLSQTDSILLGGELVQVPKSQHWKDIIIPESQWFNVNETQAYKAMNYCFENYDEVKEKALNLMKVNRDKFTLDKMTEKLDEIITPYVDKVPQQVGLNLPKLKKVGSSEAPKIKLPKLKKVTSEAKV